MCQAFNATERKGGVGERHGHCKYEDKIRSIALSFHFFEFLPPPGMC